MAERYRLQPLLEELGVNDTDAELADVAALLGVPHGQLLDARRWGMTFDVAERLAEAAQVHPFELWPSATVEFGDDPVPPAPVKKAVSPEWLSSKRAAVIVGVSYRQLDYWCRRGFRTVSEPSGCGSRRWFSRSDLQRLDVLARMMSSGLAGIGARPLVEQIDDQWSDPPPSMIRVRPLGVEFEVRPVDGLVGS